MPDDMQSSKVPLRRSLGERENVHTLTNACHTSDEVLVAEAVLEAGVHPLGHELEKHMTEVVIIRNDVPAEDAHGMRFGVQSLVSQVVLATGTNEHLDFSIRGQKRSQSFMPGMNRASPSTVMYHIWS